MSKLVRAAAVQAAPAFLDIDRSIEKCVALIEEAAKGGANLIAFPETFLPGYPWWIWHGTPDWGVARGFTQKYFENALSYDDPRCEILTRAAARAHITVVLGLVERYGSSLYIAQWILSETGDTLLKRRKLKPTHVERSVFAEGDGSGLSVVDSPVGRLGALACWEHLQPLSKYAMYAQHEQVHVAAWPSLFSGEGRPWHALGYEVNNAASQLYAAEGGCFVIAPCATVSQEMVDLICDSEALRARFTTGGGRAMIYAPSGRALTKPTDDPSWEGLVYADLDFTEIAVAKALADPAGHYARSDVTALLLDKRPKEPIRHVVDPWVEDAVLVAPAAVTPAGASSAPTA